MEGRLVGYNNNIKSYRFGNSPTRRIMESRNVTSIETCLRLFPPPLEVTSTQTIPSSNGMDVHNYIADDNLRDLCDYTSALEPLSGASRYHIAVGGLSANPPVADLLERTSDITRRDILVAGASGPSQEGAMPGDCRRSADCRRALPNLWSSWCRPRKPPWKHHWVDHRRSIDGGIRFYT